MWNDVQPAIKREASVRRGGVTNQGLGPSGPTDPPAGQRARLESALIVAKPRDAAMGGVAGPLVAIAAARIHRRNYDVKTFGVGSLILGSMTTRQEMRRRSPFYV